MKNIKNRALSILLLSFIILMGACSKDSASIKENKEEEVFEFSLMANLHTAELPNDKILQAIEKKTNTKIDIQWVPDNNYEDRLNSAFATNTLPHAVFLKNQNTFSQYKSAIKDEQFWEIGPYLDEFENLSKLKDSILDNTRVDGKLYALYQGRPLSRQGLIYRKDWADHLGLAEPKTIDDFYEMARAFTEDDPDGNGQKDTFGLTDRGDLIYGAFKTVSSWFGTPNNWGEKDGQLLPEFMFEEYKETMRFFKKLHENGYINQDFPVASSNDQIEFMTNGTAGLFVGNMEYVGTLYNDASIIHPEIEYGVQNNIQGPNEISGVWAIPGYGNLVLFPKSSVESEEELKKLLAFFDKMMTPELANMVAWGFEGEHYKVVDGKAEPVENQSLTNSEVKPYAAIEIGEPETNGRYEAFIEYETKEEAVRLVKENENHLIVDPTLSLSSETDMKDGNRLQDIITDATYQYILGQINETEFDKKIEEWKSQGGDTIIAEYNASYQR